MFTLMIYSMVGSNPNSDPSLDANPRQIQPAWVPTFATKPKVVGPGTIVE